MVTFRENPDRLLAGGNELDISGMSGLERRVLGYLLLRPTQWIADTELAANVRGFGHYEMSSVRTIIGNVRRAVTGFIGFHTARNQGGSLRMARLLGGHAVVHRPFGPGTVRFDAAALTIRINNATYAPNVPARFFVLERLLRTPDLTTLREEVMPLTNGVPARVLNFMDDLINDIAGNSIRHFINIPTVFGPLSRGSNRRIVGYTVSYGPAEISESESES